MSKTEQPRTLTINGKTTILTEREELNIKEFGCARPHTMLVETRLESWERGLYECSFDKKEYVKEDAPTRERVGTIDERYVVTKQQVINGASLVRQFAEVVSTPTRFPVPEDIAELFNRCKAVFAIAMSLDFSSKTLTRYHESRLRRHQETLSDLAKRTATIIKFIDYVRNALNDIATDLGSPDLVDLPQEKPVKTVVVKRSAPAPTPAKPREPSKPKFQLKFDDDE